MLRSTPSSEDEVNLELALNPQQENDVIEVLGDMVQDYYLKSDVNDMFRRKPASQENLYKIERFVIAKLLDLLRKDPQLNPYLPGDDVYNAFARGKNLKKIRVWNLLSGRLPPYYIRASLGADRVLNLEFTILT